MEHEPVLRRECVTILTAGGPGLYVDATLGAGGHAEALLRADPGIRVLGIDRDPAALEIARRRLADYADRVRFVRGNFADLETHLLPLAPDGAQGVLLDLGVSSMQLDLPDRGFSFMQDGPLDMRMGDDGPGAAALLADLDAGGLAALLSELGEVRRPRALARAILAARDAGRLAGTGDLRRAVESVTGARGSHAELARVFQALRIAVNDELAALDSALAALPRCLAPGGRAAVVSYHSLEDRRVKRCFRRESTDCLCPPELPVCACGHRRSFELLTPRALRPGPDERLRNPRARSARLRAVRRIVP
ncbi:MAG: 16S rRNA (cytosine(1402)-N(4))-methyltransferase RsmH [Candidatus Krumholzibacteriota bacterium]|nr:16S rRNA (cytosine(1402)-N(4))-methyltransferase RsmH [Candidatus Krumholzibacteriota bacterium]